MYLIYVSVGAQESRGIRFPGAGLSGSCALLIMGAENWVQVLFRSRTGSSSHSHLSSLEHFPFDCFFRFIFILFVCVCKHICTYVCMCSQRPEESVSSLGSGKTTTLYWNLDLNSSPHDWAARTQLLSRFFSSPKRNEFKYTIKDSELFLPSPLSPLPLCFWNKISWNPGWPWSTQ